MFELLALLLPVAAASGWFIASKQYQKPTLKSALQLDQVYFQGLNFLLDENHDKAIDLFVKLLEVDSETVEIHFALGSLFRRQGEVERSIRIHQNLIARPALTKEQRAKALFELGMDYMKAGLFDRAENLFHELSEDLTYGQKAFEQLLLVYQHEKEWSKAITCANTLQKTGWHNLHCQLAHFYCELAEESLASDHQAIALEHLNKARSIDAGCVRADMLIADIELKKGDYRSALTHYQKAVKKDFVYLPEMLKSILTCFDMLGEKAKKGDYLLQLHRCYQCDVVTFECAHLMSEDEGSEKAFDFLMAQVEATPSLNGLIELFDLSDRLNKRVPESVLKRFRTICCHLLDQDYYHCARCGFQAREPHWRCPACKQWGTQSGRKGCCKD